MQARPLQPDMSWFGVLEHHAGRTPAKPFSIFDDEVVTYGEMVARSTALAAGLHQRGVGAGDVVGLLSYNCPEFLETIFAANYLGAAAMPINWRLAAPEVRYILTHAEARRARVRRIARRARRRRDEGHGDIPCPSVHLRAGHRRVDPSRRTPGRGRRARARPCRRR